MDYALEEVAGGHIVKGKRTKRSKPNSPISFTMITTTPPPNDSDNNAAAAAPTPEDEDMARCLMLLSRGGAWRHPSEEHGGAWRHPREEDGGACNNTAGNKFCSKKYVETTTAVAGGGGAKVGMYVYECKTCGRTFPTFQALGGHRTSHTKEKPPLTPGVIVDAVKRPLSSLYEDDDVGNPYPFNNNNKTAKISPLHYFYDPANSKTSPRIHECSYCGAEFTSGQALGGHMRRHRGGGAGGTTVVAAAASSQLSPSSSSLVPQKENNNNGKCLNLDLNLPPAGEENQDHRRRGREPPENQEQQPPQIEPTLFLSTTPPLVGCKYI